MDFFSYLEELRQRPEYTRKNIAFWTSAAITFLILVVWFSFMTISPLGLSQQANVQETTTKKTPTDIVNQLKAGFEALTGQFK